MSLALPVPANAIWESNDADVPVNNPGTTVTASGTIHTKGSWTSLGLSTDFDAFGFWLWLSNSSATATRTDQLLDIGIGPIGGGSEQVIVSNLVSGWSATNNGAANMGLGRRFFLPIFIPKGLRVSARLQALIASDTLSVQIVLVEGMGNLGFPICAGMDDYGIDTANSIGTSHTPGVGVESTWANIGSTLSRNYKGVIVVPQGTMGDTTMSANPVQWEVGYSSIKLGEWYWGPSTSEWVNGPIPACPVMRELPSGTQMQVRAEQPSAAEAYDVGVYCLY